MKLGKRVFAVILAMYIVLIFSGCAGKTKKPTAEDAELYVKAVLDLMCTGDYDNSVNLANDDELRTKLEEATDEAIDDLVEAEPNLSDDVIEDYREFYLLMFSKVRYTIGNVTQAEDGFDVPVMMEPVAVGTVVEAAINRASEDLKNEPSVVNVTEEELMNIVMRYYINALKQELINPSYGESAEVVVRYKELQDGVWGVDETDITKLGEAMFRTS